MSIISTAKFTRHDLEQYLESLGAIVQSEVNSNTDVMIALHKASPNKIAKAEKLGIPIYYLEDYLENR